MSINVFEIYEDVSDRINQPENGQLSFPRFNRYSWLAQLNFIDWLSGDISAKIPPEPYLSQKNKDWLSPLITKYPKQVVNGKIPKPVDYYAFENMYLLGEFNVNTNCYEIVEDGGVKCNTPIDLLNGDVFTERCKTYIEGLQPSFSKPISKLVGRNFEYNPIDLGSLTLEYIRYPVKAMINTKIDPLYNDEVYDSTTSVDFEWDEYARSSLIWFITDSFSDFTREQALKQFNISTGKTVRDEK